MRLPPTRWPWSWPRSARSWRGWSKRSRDLRDRVPDDDEEQLKRIRFEIEQAVARAQDLRARRDEILAQSKAADESDVPEGKRKATACYGRARPTAKDGGAACA